MLKQEFSFPALTKAFLSDHSIQIGTSIIQRGAMHNGFAWIFSQYLQLMKCAVGNVARQEMHDNIWKHWTVLISTETCDGTEFCHFPCFPRGHSCHQISRISHVPWEMPDYTPSIKHHLPVEMCHFTSPCTEASSCQSTKIRLEH